MSDPIEGAAEAALVLDEGGRVVSGTLAAAAVLGVAADELVGRTISIVNSVDVDPASDEPRGSLSGEVVLGILADLSSVALFSQDAAGSVNGWNRGAERIFGYSEDDIIGEPLTLLVPNHLLADLESVLDRVETGERVDRVFTEMTRKGGMPIPIALSVSPVTDSAGKYLGAVGIAQELTEIRLAQAALAEGDQRFQEWESLAHIGRWLWDVATNAVQWSDELHRMHGVSPRDFDGTLDAHLRYVLAGDRERVRSLLDDAVATKQSFEAEYSVVGSDGIARRFTVRAEPTIGSSGDVVGVRGVSHDITLSGDRQ